MKDNSYQYYAGNMVYKNDRSLNYLLMDEGMVNKLSGGYAYEYHLKDHLGNTRVTFQPNGSSTTVTQATEYYPFGMNYMPHSPAGTNKYLYNGKEKQDDVLSTTALDWYDYGARFYDAQIGRWHSVDLLAEKYESYSPYHFSGNNPILFIDSNGMDWYSYTDDDGNVHYKYQDGRDNSIEVGENTYTNVGSTISIQLGEDYYYSAFQNYGVTSLDGPIDVLQEILGNASLQDKLLSEGSGFSAQGQKQIMTALINKRQTDFLKNSVALSGEILNQAGTGITLVGYGAACVGAEPVAGGLIGTGNSLSLIGGGIQSVVGFSSGDYTNAFIGVGTDLVGFGIGKKINNLTGLSTSDKTILRTGAELKLKLLQWLGVKANEKKK